MMQFAKTIDKVLSGEKTATSRIVKPSHEAFPFEVVTGQMNSIGGANLEPGDGIEMVIDHDTSRTIYRVGQDYAAQPGRGQKAVGRIRITGIERYDVRRILLEQVAKEGYGDDPLEFLRVWVDMHDKGSAWYWRENDGSYRQWRGRSRKWESSNAQGIYDFLATRPAAKYDAWFLTFELLKGGE